MRFFRPARHAGVSLAAALLAAGLAGGAAMAQPAPVRAANSSPIEGVWKIARPQSVLKPISGAVPFTAEGRKRYEENRRLKAKGSLDDYDIAQSRCSSPGVPRLMLTPMRFKIWDRLGVVTMDFEWNRAIRQIDVRGVKREPLLVPNATGLSLGRWQGETLIVTTTDVYDRTLIDDLVPHSDALKITERYRRIDPDTLENRITIEDPAYFSRPWDAVVTYKRQAPALFPEDVCLDRLEKKLPAIPS